MQKKISIFFAILLFTLTLAACSKKYNTTDTYVDGQDFQYTYAKESSFSTIAESEDGYYLLGGYYLYYADKSTMKPVILCNKPNCLHTDETNPEKISNCNAIFPNNGMGSISYFDGSVYVLEVVAGPGGSAARLNKLSKDGTKRKEVIKFEYFPISLAIHRGKVYATTTIYNSDGKAVYGISEYDLNKSVTQKPIDIYKGEIHGGAIQDILCYGKNLYFTEFAHNTEIVTYRVMRYDLETGNISTMFKDYGDTFPSDIVFINDKIIHSSTTIAIDTGEIITNKNIICSLDGTNGIEGFAIDNYEKMYSDGTYIYLDDVKWSPFSKPEEEQCLKVTDMSGKVLASIKTGNYSNFSKLISGSKEHLFLEDITDTVYQIYYANKNDFENGTINFKLLFEIDKEKMTPAIIRRY